MSRDLEQLLERADGGPVGLPDLAAIERRSRRLRVSRVARTAAAAAIVAALVGAILVPQLVDVPGWVTIEPVAPSERPRTDAPASTPDGVEVRPLGVEVPVPVRVLAVRLNNPSLAVADLDRDELTVYPPGVHGLPGDAIDGALVMSDRTVVIWQDGTVRAFSDDLLEPSLEHTPDQLINPPHAAPSLRVLPTADGQALWVVQIGACCPEETLGRAELVDLATGTVQMTAELPPRTFPVATLADAVLLNTERLLPPDPRADEANEGWSTVEPGSQRVLRLTRDGSLTEFARGQAVTTSRDTVLVWTCDGDDTTQDCQLDLVQAQTGERRTLESPVDGALGLAAGPDIPGDFPWNVVAPDGRILASISIWEPPSQKPTASRLAVIDPTTADITEIEAFDGRLPPAAWDRNGERLVLADGADIIVVDPTTGASFTLHNVIPDDHHIVGIG